MSIEDIDRRLASELALAKATIEKLEKDPTNVDAWGMLRAYAAGGSGVAWQRHHKLDEQ